MSDRPLADKPPSVLAYLFASYATETETETHALIYVSVIIFSHIIMVSMILCIIYYVTMYCSTITGFTGRRQHAMSFPMFR